MSDEVLERGLTAESEAELLKELNKSLEARSVFRILDTGLRVEFPDVPEEKIRVAAAHLAQLAALTFLPSLRKLYFSRIVDDEGKIDFAQTFRPLEVV